MQMNLMCTQWIETQALSVLCGNRNKCAHPISIISTAKAEKPSIGESEEKVRRVKLSM